MVNLRTKNCVLRTNHGFALIEIVVASAIVAALIAGMLGMAQLSLRVESTLVRKAQGIFLAEEALEAVRILRDRGWEDNLAPLSSGTIYYPVFAAVSSSWSLETADPGLFDGTFTRTVVFNDVYRDSVSQDVVASTSPGAVLDSGTRHARARVTWPGNDDGIELETYIADLFGD